MAAQLARYSAPGRHADAPGADAADAQREAAVTAPSHPATLHLPLPLPFPFNLTHSFTPTFTSPLILTPTPTLTLSRTR